MMRLQLTAALLLAVPTIAYGQAAESAPICTDRPTKANAVCTVAPGQWQAESSLVGWTLVRADGSETRVLALGASTVKLGLSDRSDLQVGVTPYVRATSEVGGVRSTVSGFGDVTVRYKHRLTADDAAVQVGVIPFVKIPTADRDIGNGKVEGGLAVPISIATGGPVTIVLGPEVDLLADADGDGHHAALVNVLNLSAPVAKRVTLYGELWTMTNFDPADTVTLASADTALAYAVNNDMQVDVGANFGLNRNTADVELYAGVAFRF